MTNFRCEILTHEPSFRCLQVYNINIDYIGIWNERASDVSLARLIFGWWPLLRGTWYNGNQQEKSPLSKVHPPFNYVICGGYTPLEMKSLNHRWLLHVSHGWWCAVTSQATYAKTLRSLLDSTGFKNTILVAKDGGAEYV